MPAPASTACGGSHDADKFDADEPAHPPGSRRGSGLRKDRITYALVLVGAHIHRLDIGRYCVRGVGHARSIPQD